MGGIISSEGIVYGGLDESNHGAYPEFYSLVLSGNPEDIIKRFARKNLLPKAKKPKRIKSILEEVSKRNHTFLQVRKIDYQRIKNHIIGHITGSLCEDFLPKDLDKFELYIDGKLEGSKKLYIQDLLSRLYDLSNKQIKIFCGGDYDRRYPVVNFADCMARYYFCTPISPKQLSESPHKRELQYFS